MEWLYEGKEGVKCVIALLLTISYALLVVFLINRIEKGFVIFNQVIADQISFMSKEKDAPKDVFFFEY